jgi:hypothetical protein
MNGRDRLVSSLCEARADMRSMQATQRLRRAGATSILTLALLAGCGGSKDSATITAAPVTRQQERVEAAFGKRLALEFDRGGKTSHASNVAYLCRDEGLAPGGEENWECEGWGPTKRGGCLLVGVLFATSRSVPPLEGKELQPGVGPFNPHSCKIGDEPK